MQAQTAPDPVDLATFDRSESSSGMATTYTDPDTGAWVRIEIDTDAAHLNPARETDGVEIAYLGSDARRYEGTVDGITYVDELEGDCPRCGGDGHDPIRWEVHAHGTEFFIGEHVASGSEDAMEFVADQYRKRGDEFVTCEPASCLQCNGDGIVYVSLGEYLKQTHDAIAHHVSSTGGYGHSADFVAIVTTDEFTDPTAAAKSIAEEYAAWARGDVYSITCGDSRGEDEDGSVHGFIGDDHAEAEATQMVAYTVREVQQRREANIMRGEE